MDMKKIRVELIDSSKKSVITTSKRLPSELPDKFEQGMILEIMGEEWSVVGADPIEKSEIIKTGRLRIELAKISYDNPKDTLFSLPTISDDSGGLEGETGPEGNFVIHEDDWRQLEFVSTIYEESIAEEFEDIRIIYMDHRVGIGFEKLHVRNRIPLPFSDKSIQVMAIKEILPSRKDFNALSYYQKSGGLVFILGHKQYSFREILSTKCVSKETLGQIIASNSFAWETVWGNIIWGHTDKDGVIQTMCITRDYEDQHAITFSQKMAKLTEEFGLFFVDWRKGIKINGAEELFLKYFCREERMKACAELDKVWKGKERECPKCKTVFTSIQNKGGCPKCGFVFCASHPENTFQHPF
ncbi:MAG: PHD finger domain-containing protein [Planctomycetota bacterium]